MKKKQKIAWTAFIAALIIMSNLDFWKAFTDGYVQTMIVIIAIAGILFWLIQKANQSTTKEQLN